MKRVITVEPKLPAEITELESSVKIGKGTLYYTYKDGKFDVKLVGDEAEINLILPERPVAMNPGFDGVDFCPPRPLSQYP